MPQKHRRTQREKQIHRGINNKADTLIFSSVTWVIPCITLRIFESQQKGNEKKILYFTVTQCKDVFRIHDRSGEWIPHLALYMESEIEWKNLS